MRRSHRYTPIKTTMVSNGQNDQRTRFIQQNIRLLWLTYLWISNEVCHKKLSKYHWNNTLFEIGYYNIDTITLIKL